MTHDTRARLLTVLAAVPLAAALLMVAFTVAVVPAGWKRQIEFAALLLPAGLLLSLLLHRTFRQALSDRGNR